MQQRTFLPQSTMMQKVMAKAILAVMLSGCATSPVKTEERKGYYVDHAFNAISQNDGGMLSGHALYGSDQIPQNGMLDEETRKTVAAFQKHFRPADIRGNADAETEAIARALNEKYRSSTVQSQPKGKI